MTAFNPTLRRIRSFVRRDSRMTEAQNKAFSNTWPLFGLSATAGPVDFTKVFNRDNPRVLEIGFGSGQSLFAKALSCPEQDFIGIETHKPGIGALLHYIQLEKIDNIRVFYADAVDVLTHCILERSLEAAQIFFPDPWPKRRHHKRRLIQAPFIKLLATKLKPQGILHLATDWEDYAHHMMKILSMDDGFINTAGTDQFAPRSLQRPLVTKFEKQGKEAGRPIWELQFIYKI